MTTLNNNDRSWQIDVRLKHFVVDNPRFTFEYTDELTRTKTTWLAFSTVYDDGHLLATFQNGGIYKDNSFGNLLITVTDTNVSFTKRERIHLIDHAIATTHKPTTSKYVEPTKSNNENEFIVI